MVRVRRLIKVRGLVQGVGFRPFIYRLANIHSLSGWVNNNLEGVLIDIEGDCREIGSFLAKISSAPPLAKIEELEIKELPLKGYGDFRIKESLLDSTNFTLISPDIATCPECKEEMNNINNHRYHYPFINCTNCGPRYSIIESLPYDRSVTTMKNFTMCEECRREYEEPGDRRFHAQPNACPECGPELWLTDYRGKKISEENPLKQATKLLKRGKILAIKGLAGFHLACDAGNQDTIKKLRNRKRRPVKPFALMMKDIATVKEFCYLSTEEKEILTGRRKPIVLLKRKSGIPNNQLLAGISVDNNYLAVMLPYTPLHELLFNGLESKQGEKEITVLVMTSANTSGLPLEYTNQGAVTRLERIADYFILHNREIKIPIDDSISRIILGKEQLIRGARGYIPLAIRFNGLKETLACGSHFKNTIALAKGDYIFLSQHLGDLSNLESYQNYKKVIGHLEEIYQLNPQIIAYDFHPGYLSSRFAETRQGKRIKVQHHHAHIVSCMVDNQLNKQVIGLAFDGTGLGIDGNLWGGEFLICSYAKFTRVGQLNYLKMPGGEAAVKEPWRMAVSYLYHSYGEQLLLFNKLIAVDQGEIKKIIRLIKADLNSPQTSSMGRLFDAVAALIGLTNFISYQAQAAIKLESIASRKARGLYSYQIEDNDGYFVVSTIPLIKEIVEDLNSGIPIKVIAGRFHNTIIGFSVAICELIRDNYGIETVTLSGGVFQNEIILKGIYQQLMLKGFEVYLHCRIPCNDGGLSVGQIVIANYQEGV
ncbi:MAG: carbamoyltransferase HypF [Firmicutes bacterium]|nr:carbamoyltransferase HypF [Bacillota bacterium]